MLLVIKTISSQCFWLIRGLLLIRVSVMIAVGEVKPNILRRQPPEFS